MCICVYVCVCVKCHCMKSYYLYFIKICHISLIVCVWNVRHCNGDCIFVNCVLYLMLHLIDHICIDRMHLICETVRRWLNICFLFDTRSHRSHMY